MGWKWPELNQQLSITSLVALASRILRPDSGHEDKMGWLATKRGSLLCSQLMSWKVDGKRRILGRVEADLEDEDNTTCEGVHVDHDPWQTIH